MPCTGGGQTEARTRSPTCNCSSADSGLYNTAVEYNSDYGCGGPRKAIAVLHLLLPLLLHGMQQCLLMFAPACRAACAGDNYKSRLTQTGSTPALNENVCIACKSGGTSGGGSESTCACAGGSFDGAGYNADIGCGAPPCPSRGHLVFERRNLPTCL